MGERVPDRRKGFVITVNTRNYDPYEFEVWRESEVIEHSPSMSVLTYLYPNAEVSAKARNFEPLFEPAPDVNHQAMAQFDYCTRKYTATCATCDWTASSPHASAMSVAMAGHERAHNLPETVVTAVEQ